MQEALEQQHDLHKHPAQSLPSCVETEINKSSVGEPDVNTGSADGTCPTLNSVIPSRCSFHCANAHLHHSVLLPPPPKKVTGSKNENPTSFSPFVHT